MKKTNSHQLKNIIFDLDGTLVHRVPHRAAYIQEYLADHGVIMTKSQEIEAGHWSHRFWENVTRDEPDDDRDQGNPWVQFWRHYLDQYYRILGVGRQSLEPLMNNLALKLEEDRGEEQLIDGVVDVLPVLKEKGFRLGVLSNRYSSIRSVIEQFKLAKYFEVVFSAGELESEKPDREIFLRYLELFNGEPGETLYVGDNYWLDGLGAKNAGLHPLLLDLYGWYAGLDLPFITSFTDLIGFLN